MAPRSTSLAAALPSNSDGMRHRDEIGSPALNRLWYLASSAPRLAGITTDRFGEDSRPTVIWPLTLIVFALTSITSPINAESGDVARELSEDNDVGRTASPGSQPLFNLSFSPKSVRPRRQIFLSGFKPICCVIERASLFDCVPATYGRLDPKKTTVGLELSRLCPVSP